MTHWQVQEAKQRFSEVVRDAVSGDPQVITKHGREVAVVLSVDLFQRLTGPRLELADYLLHGPTSEELETTRDRSTMRDVEFGASR